MVCKHNTPHPTSFLVGFITREDRATTNNTILGIRELHSWSVADRATCPSKCALPVSWTQGHTAFPSPVAGRTCDQALAPGIRRKGTTSTSRTHEKIPGPGICSQPLSLTGMFKVSAPLAAMCWRSKTTGSLSLQNTCEWQSHRST